LRVANRSNSRFWGKTASFSVALLSERRRSRARGGQRPRRLKYEVHLKI
jgi:hypothetical protein